MDFTQEIITPDYAARLLEGNVDNRRVRKSHVVALADAMKQGLWRDSPQPIALAPSGRLLDGQHRLLAVQMAGLCVKMAVVRNVPEASFDALDVGLRRTFSDIYQVDTRFASAATFLTRFVSGMVVQKPQILDTLNVINDDLADVEGALQRKKTFSTAPISCAAVVAIRSGESRRYVLDIVRNLSAWNFTGLPPVVSSFIRFKQIDGGRRTRDVAPQTEEFVRALAMLEEQNAQNNRISIKDIEHRVDAARVQAVRALKKPRYAD